MKEFKPTNDSRQRFEDLSLASRVWAALAKNPLTRSAGIQVVAQGGEVLITGNAGSAQAQELIPRLAREVTGVRTVRSEVGMGTDWHW